MKLAIFASALSYVAAASTSNPFAPAVTQNTAKASLNAKLLRHATPLRRLEENADDAAWALDLSTYSLKFEKCQFVKQYAYAGGNGNNNNNNKNGNNGDILTTKHFVVFRLCPDHGCESCNYKYGEYIIDLESYLESTLEYKSQVQETYCQSCNQCIEAAANGGDDNANRKLEENVDCSAIDTTTCYTECQNIENMEANGYVDASEYTGCVKLNSYDANGNYYYAGPVCGSSGTSGTSRIKIGVFTDENCMYYDDSLDISTMLVSNDGVAMSLSYHLLKETFADGKCIASCLAENNNNNNNNGEEQAAEVNELCQNLYEASGKCEQTHGFADGMKAYDEETDYEQQELNEELVCNFITAVKSGAYDLSGEIVVTGGKASVGGGTTTTGMQKFTLTFFILGTVALAGYAAMMHSQLTKGAKADLSRQGGAMA